MGPDPSSVAGSAQEHADAGHQLLQAERLGDVVVAAEREPTDLVLDGVARGEEQDGHVERSHPSAVR